MDENQISDQELVDTFKKTLNQLVPEYLAMGAEDTNNNRFSCYAAFLQAMRDEPCENVIIQEMAEALTQVKILEVMVVDLQEKIGQPANTINLN